MLMTTSPSHPVIIEAGELPPPPPVNEPIRETPPAVLRAARSPLGSSLSRLVWAALFGLVLLLLATAAWDAFWSLMERNLWIGRIALGLAAVVLAGLLIASLKEIWALRYLTSASKTRRIVERARLSDTLADAQTASGAVYRQTRTLDQVRWGRAALIAEQQDIFDGDALLNATERHLMVPLDAVALAEVQSGVRRIATATALIPMPAADVIVALYTAVRMIRRVSEAYGTRAGRFGALRLFRMVITNLVATGAVAVGDDLVSSVLGGGVMSKLSQRFGEGIINGALMARVGIAAMEICRPMPFTAAARPKVSRVVKNALTGAFSGREETPPVQ